MRSFGMVLFAGLAAAVIFLPPRLGPRDLEVRRIDIDGTDTLCADAYARVVEPSRAHATWRAFFDDLAYAAADAGPEGCGWLLGTLAAAVAVGGLWSGFRTALRRMLLTLALGVPGAVFLLYLSCFLDGRTIVLGPEARGEEIAASLHTQTHLTTGFLSPEEVVVWHRKRGFRILNVSDKDAIDAGVRARAYAQAKGMDDMLVLVGEEWHGGPDLVLVHVDRAWKPRAPGMEETIAGVHAAGGAAFIAHPWAKLPPPLSLDDALGMGLDGMEIVNGVIHGGAPRARVARRSGKALLGTIDYKYGPHVTALTLFPAAAVQSRAAPERLHASGVVETIRAGRTKVLYAVPGGAMSGAMHAAGRLGLGGAKAGVRSLLVVPRGRRAVWFAWLVGIALLWRLTTREPRSDAHWLLRRVVSVGSVRLRPRAARVLFAVCVVLECAVPAGLSWQVRERLGVVPVPILIVFAALVAVPLLAATHALASPPADGPDAEAA